MNLTKREFFAAFALQGLITKLPLIDFTAEYGVKLADAEHEEFKREVSESAIRYADELIKALDALKETQ